MNLTPKDAATLRSLLRAEINRTVNHRKSQDRFLHPDYHKFFKTKEQKFKKLLEKLK